MPLIAKKNYHKTNCFAQGSLEYLLVVGVATLVVAVVVFSLSGILSSTNDSIDNDDKVYDGLQYLIDEAKNKIKVVLILKPGKNDINFTSIEQDSSLFGVFGNIVDGTSISFNLPQEINGINEIDSTKVEGVFYQNETGEIVNDYLIPLNEIITVIVPQEASDQEISVIVNVNNQPSFTQDSTYFDNTGIKQTIENVNDILDLVNRDTVNESNEVFFNYTGEETKNVLTCLDLINKIKQNTTGKIVLQNNIDCSSVTDFVPISSFSGILDGNNYTISNLVINKNANFRGFFGKIENAIIQRINFENIEISGVNKYSGLLGGYVRNSTILNVRTSGRINSEDYAGGLIGWSYFNNVIISSSQVDINGARFVGGLIGSSTNDLILNSYARGKLVGTVNTGGLTGGAVDSNIENTYAVTEISSTRNIGGLIGASRGGSITNSYWNIDVSGLSVSAGGEGKTTQQMKTQNNYTNWNFNNTWQIIESINDGYPSFK